MDRKAFTVAEANALLPTLERVLRELAHGVEEVRRATEQLRILDVLWGEKLLEPNNPDHGEAEALRLEVADRITRIEDLVAREIRDRGLRFPPGGLEHGLIDFPTTLDGRWVFLCWRLGEPSVGAWHEIEDGFAGRREVTPEHAMRMGTDDEAGGR